MLLPAVLEDVVVGGQVVVRQPPADGRLVVDFAAGQVDQRRIRNWRERGKNVLSKTRAL